jgi:hypothetical protein
MRRVGSIHLVLDGMLLRANAHDKRIINVSLPSVEAAAALAPALGRLRAALPQHSLVFYAPAPSEGLPTIPAAVRDHYTVASWPMLHPSLVASVAASDAARDFNRTGTEALRTIEASALRTGFQPQLGLTPGQRLGLEHEPRRCNGGEPGAGARYGAVTSNPPMSPNHPARVRARARRLRGPRERRHSIHAPPVDLLVFSSLSHVPPRSYVDGCTSIVQGRARRRMDYVTNKSKTTAR